MCLQVLIDASTGCCMVHQINIQRVIAGDDGKALEVRLYRGRQSLSCSLNLGQPGQKRRDLRYFDT